MMTSADDSNNPQSDPLRKGKGKLLDQPGSPSLPPARSGSEITSHGEFLEDKETAQTGKKKLLEEIIDIKEEVAADDGGGFRTPTSSEYRIPPTTECPPAPRLKRRRSRSPSATRRCLELDTSEEVQSLFRPVADSDEEVLEPENKKARRDDGDDN